MANKKTELGQFFTVNPLWLKDPFYSGEKIQHPGYFNMLGTMISKKNIIPFQNDIVQIIDGLGVDRNRIKIDVSSKDDVLVKEFRDYYKVEYDTRKESSYSWTYGMGDNIFGRGLTFYVRQDDGSYKRIGNYIIIYDDKEPIAAEYGVGIEVLLARKDQYKNEYDAFSIAPILRNNGLDTNFSNTHIFSSVGAAYSTGMSLEQYPTKNYKKILNKFISNLLILKMKDNLQDEQMYEIIKSFLIVEFGKENSLNAIKHDLATKTEELKVETSKANDFIKNQKHLGKDDLFISQKLIQMYPFYTYSQNILNNR